MHVSEHVLACLDGKNSVLACSGFVPTASVRTGVKNSVQQQEQPVQCMFPIQMQPKRLVDSATKFTHRAQGVKIG